MAACISAEKVVIGSARRDPAGTYYDPGQRCWRWWGYSGVAAPPPVRKLGNPRGIAVAAMAGYTLPITPIHASAAWGTDGIITTVAGTGSPAPTDTGDGEHATKAKLRPPTGVAVAADGSVYIADYANSRIRRVGTDGIITRVAGTLTSSQHSRPGATGAVTG